MLGLVSTRALLERVLATSFCLPGPAWACLGLPGPAWACLGLPGPACSLNFLRAPELVFDSLRDLTGVLKSGQAVLLERGVIPGS